MNSLVCVSPGILEYKVVDDPALSKGNSILGIRRVGICGTDLHAFEGTQPFFTYPRILGHELSGVIEACDGAVGFKPGDRVTFIPYFHCGKCIACRAGKTNCCVEMNVCGVHSDGGMVEYLSIPSSSLVHGQGLSDDALAMVEPFAIGAHGIRRAGIGEGEFVLVIGAGPIGLAAMEFSRIAGARTIAMDINDRRLNFCREKLGIDLIVDGKSARAKEELAEITGGEMPVVVVDATGNLSAINAGFQYLAHGGRYVLIGLQKGEIRFSHPEFHKREATLMSSRNATRKDFDFVVSSMSSGLIRHDKFITHRVAFDQARENFANWLLPETGVIKAMIQTKGEV